MVQDRQNAVLEALTQAGRMEVSALARQLGVSAVTMRKDLEALERRGLIRREHGYAIIGPGDDLGHRLAYHYEEKRRIAELAAAHVADGETVMIESGSCCALLAEILVAAQRGIQIITNSAFIAGYVRTGPSAKIVLLGGAYQPQSQVMVGPLLRICAEQFHVDKLFIGVDGITPAYSFTNSDMMRAEAVGVMHRQAARTIVLTQSQKLTAHGLVPAIAAQDVYGLCTDAGLADELERALAARGVRVWKG